MEIKVCGVNDAPFASRAESLGANYIGLIFAEGSPRRVAVAEASRIAAGLAGRARTVGVFTTSTPTEIVAVAEKVGFSIVQLHRRASEADVDDLRRRGFEVWTLAGGAEGDAVLFDSSHGDGETALRKGPWKTVLAGGISAANVGDAIASGADVIDVSGSLESSKGVKSVALLEAFFDAVKTSSSSWTVRGRF